MTRDGGGEDEENRERLTRLAQQARWRTGGGLQSVEAVPSTSADIEAFGMDRAAALIDGALGTGLCEDMRAALKLGRTGLRKLVAGDGDLSTFERAGFEALVRLSGRPALAIVADRLDECDPLGAAWGEELHAYQDLIGGAAPSVGRIDVAGVHIGSGFVVADGVVMTNRHVLERIATLEERSAGANWRMREGVTIDFRGEKGRDEQRRFAIEAVIGARPDAIGIDVDFAKLDAALVSIGSRSLDAGAPAPLALPILLEESADEYAEGEAIAVMGYPGDPEFEPGPSASDADRKVSAALAQLFSSGYGLKRYSPGLMLPAPECERAYPWVLAHDASTTGGSSGSPVFIYRGAPLRVVGIHFSGRRLSANYAHGAEAAARALSASADSMFSFWS